jgi:hypothetical protein
MEGKVNKGIYLKEEKGVTFLYYGTYKSSCISNPAQCGPEGELGAGVHATLRVVHVNTVSLSLSLSLCVCVCVCVCVCSVNVPMFWRRHPEVLFYHY